MSIQSDPDDPRHADELTDDQLDGLLDSARQEVLNRLHDRLDPSAALWDITDSASPNVSQPSDPIPLVDGRVWETPALEHAGVSHVGDGRHEHRIAMWGAPASGKTTFLAALKVAMSHSGSWNLIEDALSIDAPKLTVTDLVKADATSTGALTRRSAEMITQHRFPQATTVPERHHVVLVNNNPPKHRRWNRRPRSNRSQIRLELFDLPGRYYSSGSSDLSVRELADLQGMLADSRGIVFLYDPIRDYKQGGDGGYSRFRRQLNNLASELRNGLLQDGKLPHYLAVCVAKFDDPRIALTADTLGILELSSNGAPHVTDANARELFLELTKVDRSGEDQHLDRVFANFFRPDRIKFFVTSSIGFCLDDQGNFDPDDFNNVYIEHGSASPSIRSESQPINVMEPLLWLAKQISSSS